MAKKHGLVAYENKAKQSQSPGFGRKSEGTDGQIVNSKFVPAKAGIVNSKSGVPLWLSTSVANGQFEKTNPIFEWAE
jgi:hypothetical protein